MTTNRQCLKERKFYVADVPVRALTVSKSKRSVSS